MDANLQKYILENCVPISEHKLMETYDDMLDECFSFGSVGGVFVYMRPSEVLEKVDNVAYHSGFCDWLDDEIRNDVIQEIEGEYYRVRDVDAAIDDWETLREEEEAEKNEEEVGEE